MSYRIKSKFYSKKDKLFHIHIVKMDKKNDSELKIDEQYSNFDEFYKATKHNLKNADLLDFDFKGYDINKYNLEEAKLSSSIMIQMGTYSPMLYNQINQNPNLKILAPEKTLDITPIRDLQISSYQVDSDDLAICYISDMHLNYNILKRFPNSINEYELEKYFEEIVNQIKESLPTNVQNRCIFFVGDTSSDFELLKKFFKIYKEKFINIASNYYASFATFFILGNHELWDDNLIKKSNCIEDIVSTYKSFFESLGIQLLENQLYFHYSFTNDQIPFTKKLILNEDEILSMNDVEIRKLFNNHGYAIFGGIGYAGKNNEFGYNQGIYGNAPLNRDEEIKRSNIVEQIHRRLSGIVPDKKIIFVTHMSKSDWTNDDYQKNWIYLSGHTHKNFYCEDENKRVYADNQIGYYNNNFSMKYTFIQTDFDIFVDYKDGIYEINREQHRKFYLGLGQRRDINKKFYKRYMIKRNNTYCFLVKSKKNGPLKLMDGGSDIRKEIGDHDINYYYDNLTNYAASIKYFLEDYNNYLKIVSMEVKKFGGDGRIHGCIVDIDFMNHIFVNPMDSSLTPYFAYDMVGKYVYPSIRDLLKDKCKKLLLNFDNNSGSTLLPALYEENKNFKRTNKMQKYERVTDKTIYKYSNVFLKLQYTTKYNVVMQWKDKLLQNSSIDSGKQIINYLLTYDDKK